LKTLRPLPLVLLLAACGGASAPPPPVATATPAANAAADDLKPMSSRDGAGAATAPGSADAQALPPGHPPLEGGAAAGAAQGAMPPGHPPVGEPAPGAKSAGSVAGTIALAPRLKAGPSDVLYIMAKQGAQTLAVRRVEKPSFPQAFEISGSDSMMGGAGAFAGPVDIVARLSRTGDAIPSKGDLEGTAKGLKVPSKGVMLTIDSVRQ
jgi:hypothetical protein